MKNTWADKFTSKAKKEGYRARSAFKLLDLNRKYKLIRWGNTVLDLGAAPGSWLQVASEAVGPRGRVIGVDLQPMGFVSRNVEVIVGDIKKQACIDEIISRTGKANVVLCDIAPSTTGVIEADQYASLLLSEAAFELAKQVLKKDGNFICKVFQGADTDKFTIEVRKHFELCKLIKPVGSRKRSKEVYIVAIGFKFQKPI